MKFKAVLYLRYLSIAACIVVFMACKKSNAGEEGEPSLALSETTVRMNSGEKWVLGYSTGGVKVSPVDLGWSSSDEQVATVTDRGEINALSAGSTTIKVRYKSLEQSCEVQVVETDYSSQLRLTSLSQAFEDQMVYSKDVPLIAPFRVMQSFDFDKSGNIFYSQIGVAGGFEPGRTKAHEVYIIKSRPNLPGKTDYMTLTYFGHGGNIAVDEDEDGLYVWIGSNATKYASGEYWDEQSVSRVRYQAGQVYNGHGGDSYFLNNGLLRIQAAVNRKNDLLCINATKNGERYFYTYRLSEAEALGLSNFTFSVKVGGEELGSVEQVITRNVQGRDLSKLTPLGSFSVPVGTNKGADVNSYAFQGYDIDGSQHIYFFEGEWTGSAGSTGSSRAYVTVFDIHGNITQARTGVQAITDVNALLQGRVTNNSGYMEGEGIKVKGNQLYLGFASYQGSEDYRRANIFKYNGLRD